MLTGGTMEKESSVQPVPKNVAKAIETYRSEYRKLFGVNVLSIEYRNGYIYEEHKTGINLKLFKCRINILRFRNGSIKRV